MCERFESGLKYEVKECVGPLEIQNRGRQFQQQKPYARAQGIARDRPSPQNMGYQRPQNPAQNPMHIVRCYHYGQERHRITECPRRTMICYVCQKLGHLAIYCREKDTVDYKDVVNNNNVAHPTS
uniref:Uncharacterized protein LOC101511419 n=1 Tax=Cicer arietinum TaxID=3827 RepID=A0A1S2Z440_CICAR|nr:uncharacterized protein LOC101511419 [Cicer arietinum]